MNSTNFHDLSSVVDNFLQKNYPTLRKRAVIDLDFVTRHKITQLNQRYRNKNSVTDVLSFPLYSHTELESVSNQASDEPILLGSLALCRPIISERAKEEGISYQKRLSWTIEHGLKHLLGNAHNPDGSKWFPLT